MFSFFILLLMSGISNGFLLDSSNSSSLIGKPTYLTVSEYYGDKNQIHSELENMQKLLHQEQQTLNQQHESYRDQQEKTINLLTNQLQQKFDLIEKKLAAQMTNNETEAIEALEKKNQELENKYNTFQGKLNAKEQMYNEIAENYTKLQEAMAKQEKNLLKVQKKCDAEVNIAVNKTLDLGQKITQIEQLQSIKQLQTLQTLQGQVQTFDSRINLLTSHEQARNQDFLALYNLTTSSKYELENKMNKQYKAIEKNLSNLTSESRNENEKLANHTMKEMDKMGRYHNSSFSLFQQNLEKQLQKVVVTSCYGGGGSGTVPAGPLKFPVIKTSVGVSNLSSFQSTGKFTCQVPGYYHIVTTLMSVDTNARIDIMKNSNSIHWQYVTGYIKDRGSWTPGTAAVALELKTNDNVWIKLQSTYYIYKSCLTIFKIN